MNANTLKAITRHGETLLAAFPNATERDPVALCKKLRRIETVANRAATHYCNGVIRDKAMDAISDHCMGRVRKLLKWHETNPQWLIFVNRDPRGYALKIDSDCQSFKDWQLQRLADRKPCLYTDMGGYGILAPDLTEENR